MQTICQLRELYFLTVLQVSMPFNWWVDFFSGFDESRFFSYERNVYYLHITLNVFWKDWGIMMYLIFTLRIFSFMVKLLMAYSCLKIRCFRYTNALLYNSHGNIKIKAIFTKFNKKITYICSKNSMV